MLAPAASAWEAVPTELDELWCPSIEFVAGSAESNLTLLVEGGARPSRPAFEGQRHFLLRFFGVEAVSGYAESLYCIDVRPVDSSEASVGTIIQRAGRSEIVDRTGGLGRSDRVLFAILGGGMQCEVVARPEFVLEGYRTREAALQIALRERPPQAANFEADQPEARAVLESFRRRGSSAND